MLMTDRAMLMKLPLVIGPLAAGTLLLAFALGCTDEAAEDPVDGSQAEDAQACPSPAEPSVSASKPSDSASETTPHLQSPQEAAAQDDALFAESQGITVEQAEAQRLAADALDPITSNLAAERPDIFIGSALVDGSPTLYIKGPADDFVRDLVASAAVEIEIVDNQPYSRAELDKRQAQVVRALQEQGFTNFGAGTDITNGQIEATVTRQSGLPDDPDEILADLPSDLRENVTLTVSDAPVGCEE